MFNGILKHHTLIYIQQFNRATSILEMSFVNGLFYQFFFLSFRYGCAAQSVMLPNLGSDLPTGDNGSLVILSWLALGSGKIFMK